MSQSKYSKSNNKDQLTSNDGSPKHNQTRKLDVESYSHTSIEANLSKIILTSFFQHDELHTGMKFVPTAPQQTVLQKTFQ